MDEYSEVLEVASNGSVVLLKHQRSERMVNDYSGLVMLAWQANMDLQYVLNAYACIMYVASYIMKTDRAMGQLLKRVASEARTDKLRSKVGSTLLCNINHTMQHSQRRGRMRLPHTSFSCNSGALITTSLSSQSAKLLTVVTNSASE